ncbi:CYTH and CHAD domain-containing protein [Cryobacterium psychrophilum]|uniref:CYTH and CHAD domain-containing protein n=1 Tax=Cryobacterium psychrophilum TaxID=41988 RepID=A0A4Y8KRV8_9MICO|nr:CYTH and CHAD domain-containing protein [Cryobacterium psychrophilum]TDW31056.1 CHAD domain-containing protein [Cryobacterium psychrophilum]TFD78644.1 CYTH and CHAD domain-containing protein [Cryobacterium psychrophilum]
MDTSSGREIELKFDVDDQSELPRLQDLPGVTGIERPVEHHLEAVYFDTDSLMLAAHHITLRRRAGGDDAGWHLKLPIGASERQEIHAPLTGDSTTVPESLARLVRVLVRDRPLVAVALLRTRRIVHRLRGPEGESLADVCDDRVEADRLVPAPEHASWREWEIELVEGPVSLLDAGRELLAAGGIRPSIHASKLGRALGDLFPAEPTPAPVATSSGAAASVLLAYAHDQVRTIAEQDPRVRNDAPEAVHEMRVATRRLRTALATYAPLLADEAGTARLRTELRWLSGTLGAARDEHVQEARLLKLVSKEPTELLLGPVAARVAAQFEARAEAALGDLLSVLDGTRYFRLLDDLDDLLAAPRFTNLAYRSARKVIPDLLERDWKRVRKAVRAAAHAPAGPEHDHALHEVRKSAKRLRYAAETALPVRRTSARRLATDAQKLQTILGEHQDSVIARDLLLGRCTAEAYAHGENTFTYGRLHAREEQRGADAVARFHRAWKAFSRPE